MRRAMGFLFAAIFPASPLPSVASECWAVSNIKGHSAYADASYEFSQDRLPNRLLMCIGQDGGTVTGTDTRLVKFGNSTLAGFKGNDKGNELFEAYQIDRNNNKLLYVRTRIGTKTVAPILSDVVSSFVGDAVKISE